MPTELRFSPETCWEQKCFFSWCDPLNPCATQLLLLVASQIDSKQATCATHAYSWCIESTFNRYRLVSGSVVIGHWPSTSPKIAIFNAWWFFVNEKSCCLCWLFGLWSDLYCGLVVRYDGARSFLGPQTHFHFDLQTLSQICYLLCNYSACFKIWIPHGCVTCTHHFLTALSFLSSTNIFDCTSRYSVLMKANKEWNKE